MQQFETLHSKLSFFQTDISQIRELTEKLLIDVEGCA
jgi:hypothetical protein